MHWGLRYIGKTPTPLEELATRAHDMEQSIAANDGQGPQKRNRIRRVDLNMK